MARLLAFFLALLWLCGCNSTSYKLAPSTAQITTKLATAARSNQEAQKRAAELEAVTARTQVAAITTEDHIDKAMAAILAKDYVTGAQELTAAKMSSELVKFFLEQSFREVKALNGTLKATEKDLADAEEGAKELNKKIAKLVLEGAADRAIVDEVNWGFRIGALFYFVKGVLKIGFFGSIILIVLIIVILAIGAYVGGPAGKLIFKVAGKGAHWIVSRRKPDQTGS